MIDLECDNLYEFISGILSDQLYIPETVMELHYDTMFRPDESS